MSKHVPAPVGSFPAGSRVAVVAARFNAHIVDKLRSGCATRLRELNAETIEEHFVPGAFELPLAAQWLAESGQFDAVICLGCVVRGDTPHFDFVAGECARGLREVGLKTSVPVIFGVLTTNTEEQAHARAGGHHGHAGISSADAAAEMVALKIRATAK